MTIPRDLSNLAPGANTSGVLQPSKGGTGLTSPGSNGNVLTSNGTAWVSSAPAGGGSINVQTFTSSGTWTKPSGYAAGSRVLIQAWGGGASGGRYPTRAGGGGGGGYNERWITLSAMGSTETVTIGAGGTARTTDGIGNGGGTTSVGSLISAYGGAGGNDDYGGGGGGQTSAGGASTNPAITSTRDMAGGPGLNAVQRTYYAVPEGTGGQFSSANWYTYGTGAFKKGGGGGLCRANCGDPDNGSPGGNSVWGGGGGGGVGSDAGAGGTSSFGGSGGAAATSTNATAGSQPGGGGGGCLSANSGAGGAGQVIITVFPA